MSLELGFITFTDHENSESAIAAIGREEPFHIESIRTLNTSTRWMTNLTSGLPNNPKQVNHTFFLQNNYLRVSTEKILESIFLDPEKNSAEQCTSVLAKIFSNTINLGEKILLFKNLPRFEYRKGVRKALMPEDVEVPENVAKMVLDSTQYYTFSLEKTNPDKRIVFTLPKVQHAKNILRTSLPAGTWEKIKKTPKHTEDISDWLSSQKKPLFARVTLSDFDPEVYSLINFGSATPSGSERQWITNIDLEMLMGSVEIQIHEVWQATEVLNLSKPIENILTLPSSCELSYSLGLLAENTWTGLALNNPPGHIRRNKSKVKKYVNTCSPFIRAIDRKLCFEKALALHHNGFTVASYGFGNITVDASFQEEMAVIETAINQELIPPLCPELQIEVDLEKDSYFSALQAYYATGNTLKILEFDEVITDKITRR